MRQNSLEPTLNVSEFRKLEASNHIEESLKEDLTKFSEPDSNQPDQSPVKVFVEEVKS